MTRQTRSHGAGGDHVAAKRRLFKRDLFFFVISVAIILTASVGLSSDAS